MINGPLQKEILKIIWERGPLSGRDLVELINAPLRKKYAYNTVLTIIEKMRQKGIILRRKIGKSYFFWPRVTKDNLLRNRVHEFLQGLVKEFSEPVMSHFLDSKDRIEPEKVEELVSFLKERGLLH